MHTLHTIVFPPPDLFLNNSTVRFAQAVKYLGLLLDSKLLWESHLRWLGVKHEQSLNILKVLSGRFWGKDWTVMLQCALIHSKIDSGSFINGSVMKSRLSIIDPVHNTGICLKLAPSIPAGLRVYVWNQNPFCLWGNRLLSSYAAKLKAHPSHPSCSVVFQPTNWHRFELHTTVPWPLEMHFHDLLHPLEISLPYIIPLRLMPSPLWHIKQTSVTFGSSDVQDT